MNDILQADSLEWMRDQPDNCVDMTFTSPPYEDARTYGIDFKVKGEAWVEWFKPFVIEAVRITKGLVAVVVEGKTRKFAYSVTPFLLLADLHRSGIVSRKPVAFHRVGIPGSGGPDWLRNDWEPVLCFTSGGKLPWSHNTACGHPTKYDEGGRSSNRKRNGVRVNQEDRKRVGSHRAARSAGRAYAKPRSGIANPGNVIHCKVGGGLMGDPLAHDNEAPFPESLAEFFIKSFCPPDGVVLDPFCGSGTTCAVAWKNDRQYIGVDLRESQVELTRKRIRLLEETLESELEGVW